MKLKKTPSKVAQKYSNFFCLTALAQTEEFMIQNVAYGPNVIKLGFLVKVAHKGLNSSKRFTNLLVINFELNKV